MTPPLPEPTEAQLLAALTALAAAAPGIWPGTLAALGENAKKLVRARALQAIQQADLRSRERVAVPVQRADGSWRTIWVAGPPTPQLAITKDVT